MKTSMVEVREGEFLGPIDWSYDFSQYGLSRAAVESGKEMLRQLEQGGRWEATTDGGWPRVGWHEVIEVGMYDGWPYWKPTPSVHMFGVFGTEWHSWSSISEIRALPERS